MQGVHLKLFTKSKNKLINTFSSNEKSPKLIVLVSIQTHFSKWIFYLGKNKQNNTRNVLFHSLKKKIHLLDCDNPFPLKPWDFCDSCLYIKIYLAHSPTTRQKIMAVVQKGSLNPFQFNYSTYYSQGKIALSNCLWGFTSRWFSSQDVKLSVMQKHGLQKPNSLDSVPQTQRFSPSRSGTGNGDSLISRSCSITIVPLSWALNLGFLCEKWACN